MNSTWRYMLVKYGNLKIEDFLGFYPSLE